MGVVSINGRPKHQHPSSEAYYWLGYLGHSIQLALREQDPTVARALLRRALREFHNRKERR
jgi:hypothetical protein